MDEGSLEVVIVARSASLREELAVGLRDAGLIVLAEVAAVGDWQPHREADCVVVAHDEVQAAFDRVPPEVAVLLLGDAGKRQVARLAASGRRWGVVPRGAGLAAIVAAIEMLARGFVVIPAGLARDLSHGQASAAPEATPLDPDVVEEPLTPRELEVLELVAEGHSNKVVAAKLGISEHTVKFHLAAVCGKLGASSRTEAVRLAVRRGLLTL